MGQRWKGGDVFNGMSSQLLHGFQHGVEAQGERLDIFVGDGDRRYAG